MRSLLLSGCHQPGGALLAPVAGEMSLAAAAAPAAAQPLLFPWHKAAGNYQVQHTNETQSFITYLYVKYSTYLTWFPRTSRVEWSPRNPEVMGMQTLDKLCRDQEVLQASSPTCAWHCQTELQPKAIPNISETPKIIHLGASKIIHTNVGGRELAAGLPRAWNRRLWPAPVQHQSTAKPGQPWKKHSIILRQKEAEMQLNSF